MVEPHPGTWRILDAAANRAREGLRVVEDYVRFCGNDADLSRRLKECRHDLTAALTAFPEAQRLAARNTPGDVGTAISTPAEAHRASPFDVARASLKRVQEALRTLEEYGKIVDPAAAARFEQLRYRVYGIESDLGTGPDREQTTRETRAGRLADQPLYLLVTADRCAQGLETTVRAALDAGVRLIQVREKKMADRPLLDLCHRVREWTAESDALLIINDRPDLAVLAEADGVHVGQEELRVAEARRIVGPDRLVGVSTHEISQARQAVSDGADYLGVGPTFVSGTKEFASFPGVTFVAQVAAEISRPWFAIGGIDASNLGAVRAAGATRVAVSGAVCAAAAPGVVIAELLRGLKK